MRIISQMHLICGIVHTALIIQLYQLESIISTGINFIRYSKIYIVVWIKYMHTLIVL